MGENHLTETMSDFVMAKKSVGLSLEKEKRSKGTC